MRTVWKFELLPYVWHVSMPAGAEVLAVAAQGDRMFVWALCDPIAARETRRFVVAGTGEPMPPSVRLDRFVGTVHMGALVWHVWEGDT